MSAVPFRTPRVRPRPLAIAIASLGLIGLPALAEETTLSEVSVTDKRESQGETVIDRNTIDAMPGGNGDITSLLKIHPNVQFNNNQAHTGQQGEIAPADISINGSKYYENLYQIDGMGINNDINPAQGDANNNASPASASQGFAIDTSLICKVTVRDSNIGAEFGHFTGGMVGADTCAPTRKFGGKVSVETTRSSWMKYKIAPQELQAYEQSTGQDKEKRFEKWTYRAALEAKPSDDIGIIASFVRRTSEIPLQAYANGAVSAGDASSKTEKRLIDNVFVRGFWNPSTDIEADLSFQDAPGEDRHFISNAKNSFFEMKSGGQAVNGGLKWKLDGLTLSNRLAWSTTQSSRNADASTWKLWRYSADKNWGYRSSTSTWNSGEGGYGDVDQRQTTLNYQFKGDWLPVQLLGLQHRFQAGLELEHKESYYERKTQYEQYTASTNTTTCNTQGGGVDTAYCSMTTPWNASSGGQYLKNKLVYFAGKFTVADNARGLYLQDELSYRRFSARLGLRYDDSELAPKATVSGRTALFLDVFGDGKTKLEAGRNRYYGRNFLTYYTYKERLSLQSGTLSRTLSGGVLTNWATPVAGSTSNMYHLGDLAVPHEDESMFGLRQKWAGAVWGIKRVMRDSRDEVVLHLRSVGNYWWDNVGKSKSDTWSLTAETQAPISWAGTHTSILAAIDRTDVKTSHADYSDALSNLGLDLERTIRYDGKYIRWIDRPADNYDRPFTARLLFNTQIPAAGLSIGNFIRYRASFEKMAVNGQVDYNGTMVDNYEKAKFGSAITWDMRINYALPTINGQEATLTLTVENLLNRSNAIEDSSGDYLVYEKGRQFWLELGYRF